MFFSPYFYKYLVKTRLWVTAQKMIMKKINSPTRLNMQWDMSPEKFFGALPFGERQNNLFLFSGANGGYKTFKDVECSECSYKNILFCFICKKSAS